MDEDDVDEDEVDGDERKDVIKAFLESVVNLVKEVRPTRTKRKKEPVQDLMKSLKDLLQ